MYGGTVRALFHIDDPIEKNENINILSGSTLSCGIMTNLSLLKIQHLLPENVIVGQNDIVPGVVDSIHTDTPLSEFIAHYYSLVSTFMYASVSFNIVFFFFNFVTLTPDSLFNAFGRFLLLSF